MNFSMLPLLVHSESVPVGARNALRAAYVAPPERRDAELIAAARVLFQETDLDCVEARDLVGLPACGSCQ
jgi:hypothetical protein